MLGGGANFAAEYATKRYRSNLINWGIFPFLIGEELEEGDHVLVPRLRRNLLEGSLSFDACVIRGGKARALRLSLGPLTADEKQTLLDGCLINFYREGRAQGGR